MLDYSNPLLIQLRQFGQGLGILRPLVGIYRRLANSKYEESFDEAMLSRISEGDIVWDVGANIGIFTAKFSSCVGTTGQVVAFEPSPDTYLTLSKSCDRLTNVRLANIALANFTGTAKFSVSSSENSVTNSIAKDEFSSESGCEFIEIKTYRAADFASLPEMQAPNIVKIDVEGFEDDVLFGFGSLLTDTSLRGIFIEVHFLELNKRNRATAPTEMTKTLRAAGFTVRWTDPSHIMALRE